MKFLDLWVATEDKEEESLNQKYSKLIDISKDEIFDSIKSYILDIRKRELSTSAMNGFIYAIKHFYEMNDIDLGSLAWKKLKKFMGEETEKHEDRAYTREEIQTLLNFSDIKLKAIVLLLSSTGMRIGALGTMLKSHLEDKGNCYGIKVYKGCKGGGKYLIWCSPEARKALEDYFQYRERYGEKIGPNSPVFRNDFDTDIIESARRVKSLSSDAMRIDIYEHLVKAGLRIVDHVNINNRNEVGMTKGFRKFFKTQLVLARVDPELRELFIGHSQKKLEHVYTRMTEDQIFEEYSKAIPFLTIDPANKLQNQVQELTEKQDDLTLLKLEHRQEMNEMREEIKVMMSMIRQNPKLVNVKPESLKKKLK